MTPGAPVTTPDRALTTAVLAELRATALVAVGVAPADPFVSTRHDLLERRAAGLHGGMNFTYRNPTRSTDPGRIVDDARSLVVGALDYLRAQPAGEEPGALASARVARYAWSDQYRDLRACLTRGADLLQGAGYRAEVVVDDNALVDREAARRAGIGWFGHNANLLREGGGSWFVLGSIVTDATLVPSGATESYGCGSCVRCIDECPTAAIVAPGVVDARRCLAWLLQAPGVFPRQFRAALGDRMYGCDECQEVCPPNVVRARRSPPPPPGAGAHPTVDVAAFLVDDDAEVMRAAGRWYVANRDPRHLRRNALIVLGNAGDPDDERVIGAVTAALAHDDPLVRAHAVWTAARLGRPDLADGLLTTEADPMVREELEQRDDVPARR